MNSKKHLQHRMVRKKRALDSRISKLRQRKISVGNDDDDDSSVDSQGNLKGLIDYDSEESLPKINNDESSSEEEEEEAEESPNIRIDFGAFAAKDPSEKFKPKRYDLTKEPEIINKFVELVTKQTEAPTIDDQIDQFKELSSDKQKQMVQALERKPDNEQSILFKILTMNLPADTQRNVLAKYNSLQNMEPSASEYHKLRSWLEKLSSIPLGIYKDLPARIEDGPEACNKYMNYAQECLADAIYGQEEAKIQILQFIATKMANPAFRGVSLLLTGPPGVGKCHAKNTPILMADGSIKLVQDIIINDNIMGDDSNPRKVLSLGCGKDNMYDIIPVKGESYRVNSEHILCLTYSGNGRIRIIKRQYDNAYKAMYFNNITRCIESKTFNTKNEANKYLHYLKTDENVLEISVKDYLKLPTTIKKKLKGYRKGVEFPHIIPEFNPYIIGLWLGDGCSRSSKISNQDSAILSYLRNTLPQYGLMLTYHSQYDYNIRAITNGKKDNILLMNLKKHDMLNNKHIPAHYKINSREVRLQVLAGLIDSDGSLVSQTYQITTTIKQLKDDILYISHSLGFAAYYIEKKTSWIYKGVKNYSKAFSIHISGNIDEIPVKIERKKAYVRRQVKDVLVSGITVKESGYDDYYGFTLDGNHRYLMGDFTVTHNTSLIKNGIAKALNWPFQFISLGGDSDATTYVGHQVVYEGSHCGKIVNSLVAAKSMSMVLMFDELDKISQTPRGEEVQNLLVHMTDAVQNSEFEDKYLSGIPIDLSKIMFVFSGNDLNKIDKVLMDRMIVIKIQGYTIKDKVIIAEKFLIANALAEVNLQGMITFTKEIIHYILEKFAKEEAGVREFKRCIEEIVQKINMLRIFNSEKMPFYIADFSLPFTLKESHVDLFLKKKKTEDDMSYLKMYN